MPDAKDYYKILGVSKDASVEAIKRAYRDLAKKYHPDLHPNDKGAEAKFKEINEAYAVLSDPQKRRDYDTGARVSFEGFSQGYPGGPYGAPGGFDFSEIFGGAGGGGFGGAEDLFGDFFGGGGRGRKRPQKGRDLESFVELDFMRAVKGAEVEITIKRDKGPEKVKVRIPPGVTDGSRVKVAGKGAEGGAGIPPGDLYIVTGVRPHQYFLRDGADIYVDVPITASEAVLGAEIEVPTLDGFTTIKIPPGTQGGRKLRLKGKGVPYQGGAGDEYIVLNIVLPKEPTKKEQELYEELREINLYEPRKGLW